MPDGTSITITESTTAAPATYEASGPLYQFAPDGLVFAAPVKIKLAFTGSRSGVVYWSNALGGYDTVPTRREGDFLVAAIAHFSSGFAAYGESAPFDAGGSDASTGSDGAVFVDAGPGPSDSSIGPDAGSGGGSDASTGSDGGVFIDAGAGLTDASVSPDAGSGGGSDVSTSSDGGVFIDAGAGPTDASVSPDAGSGGGLDASTAADGGVFIDAGPGPSDGGGSSSGGACGVGGPPPCSPCSVDSCPAGMTAKCTPGEVGPGPSGPVCTVPTFCGCI